MSTPAGWAHFYARQARADFDTYSWMSGPAHYERPECHRLLFLQMACEKLTKASLCQNRIDVKELHSSHAYTRKNLPRIVEAQLLAFGHKRHRIRAIMPHVKHLATEIELLAPAVKRDGQRLDNCEYPWEDLHGQLHSPLDAKFAVSQLVAEGTAGRIFLKAISAAIDGFGRTASSPAS